MMDLTTTAYGTWSGGRFMHYGEMLDEERWIGCVRTAYENGIRTFVTADVYGAGRADELLGKALEGIDRESYCLVGMLGHDHYEGEREGSKGYPRFTDPRLRGPEKYEEFLTMCAERSLERCQTDFFDCVLLHNPDELGYTSDAVWKAMESLKERGLTGQLGLAPGPANGFTLDLIKSFETYESLIDWTMIILNPLEPWPGQLVLPAAKKHGVKLLTRVVDYGGLLHGDLEKGHQFKPGDHRGYRPDGWIEHGLEKYERMKSLQKKYELTPIQFASVWNLSQPMVESVVPTFLQEPDGRPIEEKIVELGELPDVRFTDEEVAHIAKIGDNTGCMALKGASRRHTVSERADEWPMRSELLEVANAYDLGLDW